MDDSLKASKSTFLTLTEKKKNADGCHSPELMRSPEHRQVVQAPRLGSTCGALKILKTVDLGLASYY